VMTNNCGLRIVECGLARARSIAVACLFARSQLDEFRNPQSAIRNGCAP